MTQILLSDAHGYKFNLDNVKLLWTINWIDIKILFLFL